MYWFSTGKTSFTGVELSDDEIVVLDVVNASEPTEPMEEVTNSEVCAVIEPPETFESELLDAKTAQKQVSDLIRQAPISAKIMQPDLAVDTTMIEPGPIMVLEKESIDGLEARRSDEAKGLLAKVKAVITLVKFEVEHKMKTQKRKMLKQRAEGIVHPAHKGAIPIQLKEGDGPSRAEVRVAKLKAEFDLSPQALPPQPVESEEVEFIPRTKNGGRFHTRLPVNGTELAQMVGCRHHMMPREAAVDIAKQFELTERDQVDLVGQVKICRQRMVWFASTYVEGNISKGCLPNVLVPHFRK